ncbi:MAG: CDP-glycerol glycerophosphotransferase family protein, partial [Chlamydiae bacterium]|nr:CDP-glycerol glycerophosphotransferase family protein [Chlamydiota bacterium]
LEQIDLYIGDFSSVAYDFLKFDRPLFFMADSVDPKLLPCGHKIEEGNIFSQLENEGSSDARQQLYNDCFADIPPKELRCRLTS